MKRSILIIIIFLVWIKCFSQNELKNIPNKNISQEIKSLYSFLLTHTTDININAWKMKPEQVKIYDSLITIFFNRNMMMKKFQINKMSNIYTQYQSLYSIDQAIDFIPADSVYFENEIEYFKNNDLGRSIDLGEYKNRLFAGFYINNKFYPVLDMDFDEKGKFIFVLPMIYFDDNEGKIVNDFLQLQKDNMSKSITVNKSKGKL